MSATSPRGSRTGTINLAHGAGGRAMRALIEQVFVPAPTAGAEPGAAPGEVGLADLDDGAALALGDGRWLVITTDSHVVQPRFFPGGDIGSLAISGTVNDLAVMGATEPLALTCSVIVEEGFPRAELERVQASMQATCERAGARVVTGDTKVMGRGELDGLVLNTAGVGLTTRVITDAGLRVGDRVIVTGTIGDHGLAVLAARHDLRLEGDLRSDVAPINSLVARALAVGGPAVVALKDPTRGGLAGALHELAAKAQVGLLIDAASVPTSPEVRAASELLGIDPLHVANEGKAVIGVHPAAVDAVLAALHAHPLGARAAVIGTAIASHPGRVVLDTGFGQRLMREVEGEPLPRIC